MTKRNITDEELDDYILNIDRVSLEYDIKPSCLFDLLDYQDDKRIRRGEEENLERSLEIVERYLRVKKK